MRADWELECRRCLGPVSIRVAPAVTEVFEPAAVAGETYPLEGEVVDLAPMLREVVLLTLPLAPLCEAGCDGPVPGGYFEAPCPEVQEDPSERRDPRWAALDDFNP